MKSKQMKAFFVLCQPSWRKNNKNSIEGWGHSLSMQKQNSCTKTCELFHADTIMLQQIPTTDRGFTSLTYGFSVKRNTNLQLLMIPTS